MNGNEEAYDDVDDCDGQMDQANDENASVYECCLNETPVDDLQYIDSLVQDSHECTSSGNDCSPEISLPNSLNENNILEKLDKSISIDDSSCEESDVEESSDKSSECSVVDMDMDYDEDEGTKLNESDIKTLHEMEAPVEPVKETEVASIDINRLVPVGILSFIILEEKNFVIKANSNLHKETLDEKSILFLPNGIPLGKIYDVFGPVLEPFYSIRWEGDLSNGKFEYYS